MPRRSRFGPRVAALVGAAVVLATCSDDSDAAPDSTAPAETVVSTTVPTTTLPTLEGGDGAPSTTIPGEPDPPDTTDGGPTSAPPSDADETPTSTSTPEPSTTTPVAPTTTVVSTTTAPTDGGLEPDAPDNRPEKSPDGTLSELPLGAGPGGPGSLTLDVTQPFEADGHVETPVACSVSGRRYQAVATTAELGQGHALGLEVVVANYTGAGSYLGSVTLSYTLNGEGDPVTVPWQVEVTESLDGSVGFTAEAETAPVSGTITWRCS